MIYLPIMSGLLNPVPLPPVLGTVSGPVDKEGAKASYFAFQQLTGGQDKNAYLNLLRAAEKSKMVYGIPAHLKM